MGSPARRRSGLVAPVVKTVVHTVVVTTLIGLLAGCSDGAPPPAATTTAAPKPSLPVAPGGEFGYASARATDPDPLTQNEIFGRSRFTSNGRKYKMTVRKMDKVCKDAVTGDKLTKALKAAGCTQLARASFHDAKGEVIGTVGVANLKTSKGAKGVAGAGAGKERKDYLKPLAGDDAHTKELGDGEAYAGGWTHGHYAILLWFQFKDGHEPKKAELKRLYQAAVDITDAIVFPPLDSRSVRGSRS
ncbi:hypothetical protein [Herbidospora mongoliensis]|uniref:hypothetical protein n=1 Tax=Herbidospora mongoliensis TaxID=688067 RepID=UPI0012FC1280|nr:hypothetical protein [Herbidospora mongoliensis]